MKRAVIAAMAVIGSLLVAAGPAGADDYVYCGANDVRFPTISNVTLSPSSVVIGRANKTMTMTVSAADDCAIDHITVPLWPKGVETRFGIFLTDWTLISGTKAKGTWRATKTLSDQQPGGLYQILWVDVTDTHFNPTRVNLPRPTMQVWHETSTTLKKPKSPVKNKVALAGRLNVYGGFGTWTVQIQKHAPGKKWSKVKDVKTNAWGDFGTLVDVKGTTYLRAIHYRDNTTVGSASSSYKVTTKK